MKKIMLIVVFVAVFSLFPSIEVLTPNGSETITRGTQYEITWLDNISENVKIQLFQDVSFLSEIAVSTESDGSFLWSVPADFYGDNLQIVIISTLPPDEGDISDNYFSVPLGNIAVTSPNGSESLKRGTQYEITWTDDIDENVKIELFQNGSFLSEIAASTESDGSYMWDIPDGLYGELFQIVISSTVLPALSDPSDYYFKIPFSKITVLSPNGWETLSRGTQLEITWTDGTGGFENVKIELFQDGSFLSVIAVSTESDGSFLWDIPNYLYGSNYQIVISSSEYSDTSDAAFSIQGGNIAVTSPNGGESLIGGTQFEITWTDDIDENVKIELLRNGSFLSEIAVSTESDGSYMWDIPEGLYGELFQIVISSTILPALSDPSDGYFSIPYTGTLSSPTNVLLIFNNDQVTISWDIVPDANSYNVYWSVNPYGDFEVAASVSTNSWGTPITTKQFYYIVASTRLLKSNNK